MKIFIGPYPEDEGDQQIDVHIDNYDVWSMDCTLSHIIVPMLKMLKESKQGVPFTDLEDAPEELRVEDTDENIEWQVKRWEWILDEMIWSFEQKLIDWESQYCSGEHNVVSKPCDAHGNILPEDTPEDEIEFYTWEKGPNHTFEVDNDGVKAHHNRMSNGFRLFGKYFESLWA